MLTGESAILWVAADIVTDLLANHNNTTIKPIRVACIGDSITEVSGYPEYLQTLLSSDYVVGNFGVCGSTVVRGIFSSYMDQHAFQEAKNFAPNLVVIMLGTNDASSDVYENIGVFEVDYKELINEFQAIESNPKFGLQITPIFNDVFGPSNDNLVQGIIPSIKRAADELRLPIIDVYSALVNHPEYFLRTVFILISRSKSHCIEVKML